MKNTYESINLIISKINIIYNKISIKYSYYKLAPINSVTKRFKWEDKIWRYPIFAYDTVTNSNKYTQCIGTYNSLVANLMLILVPNFILAIKKTQNAEGIRLCELRKTEIHKVMILLNQLYTDINIKW